MSSPNLHTSLLRLPVLHILRAAGFHSTKASVLDVAVNLTERYLLLLATTAANHAQANHNTPTPNVTDVRMALTDCGVLLPSASGAEEEWEERSRRPLADYDDLPYGDQRRPKITQTREDADTRDIREFLDWIKGDKNKELRRIAGTLPETGLGVTPDMALKEDYLTALKKKHSKTGEEARYAGTVLGKPAEHRDVTIEGGPSEAFEDWARQLLEQGTANPHDTLSTVTT